MRRGKRRNKRARALARALLFLRFPYGSNRLMVVLTKLSSTDPSKAAQKLVTLKPSTKEATK